MSGAGRPPGSYARHVTPAFLFTSFDVADRLGCSRRHVFNLLRKYGVEAGILRRPVRLADGSLVFRRVLTLTPTALEVLLLLHAGYKASRALGGRR